MAIPKREPSAPFEARPKINLIEMNTIAGAKRHGPYIFKPDAQPLAPRMKPFRFPENLSEPEESRDIRLFEFLAASAGGEASAPDPADPWARWTDALAQKADPDEVSEMLANLLERLDAIAQERARVRRRMLPKWAPLVPPLSILSAQALSFVALERGMAGFGLAAWTFAAPLIAGLFAVPLGLMGSSFFLGAWLRRVKPGTEVRFGAMTGTVTQARRLAWAMILPGKGPRRLPYYLTAFAAPERVSTRESIL